MRVEVRDDPRIRVALTESALVATAVMRPGDRLTTLLTTSDVLGTGWCAAGAVDLQPGMTVVVVGDGALGLLAVLWAERMGVARILAMSRHAVRPRASRAPRVVGGVGRGQVGSIPGMQAREALEAFRAFAQDHGKDLPAVTGSEALDLMTGFYGGVRADDCDLESDADLLFCEWGTYDWGEGEHFEFHVFRQFFFPPAHAPNLDGVLEDADEYIWHLDLMMRFTPSSELRQLGRGSRICRSLADLAAFGQSVRSTAAFAAVQGRSDGRGILRFECAG